MIDCSRMRVGKPNPVVVGGQDVRDLRRLDHRLDVMGRQTTCTAGEHDFTQRPGYGVALSIIAAGSLAAAVYFYSEEGLSWLTAFFAGFSVFCGAGIIESFTAYIALEDTEVRFRQTLRSTAIPRSAIRRVTWEGGSGVSLLLDDGSWVKLPDLGQNSQGLTNSIRAWMRDA